MKKWLVLLLLGASTLAAAVQMPDLYTAQVVYESQRRDGRERAYASALSAVLRRITPDANAAWQDANLAPASQFVLGFREANNDSLWVSFDGPALTAALRDAGLAVWGAERPLTIVWLAVETEEGERQLVAARPIEGEAPEVAALRETLRQAGSLYGLPLSFPVLDETDTEAVTDSDVWGGFTDRIRAASRRYNADSVLIGRMPASDVSRARWTWTFADARTSVSGDVQSAVDRVAGRLIEQFASQPGASIDMRIRVVGVDSAIAYAEVSRLLANQSLISNVDVVSMHGDSVIYQIDALASRERLAQLLVGDVIELLAVTPTGGDSADLYFGVVPGLIP
ncbi:MAG: DUF2066 domain-containing protein [Pseudomonadota bacterium]